MENRKTFGTKAIDDVLPQQLVSDKVVYVSEPDIDEINLGELLRNISKEWKTILLVVLIGVILSIACAYYLTRSYMVEAIIRLPNVNEMGDLGDQKLVEISPDIALAKFVDQLTLPSTQVDVFESSSLFDAISEDPNLVASQTFSGIRKKLTISRVKHKYYELGKTEKTPFKEVSLSLVSAKPELAADYIQQLMTRAHEYALIDLTNDISATRSNRIQEINEQLESLTAAADASRKAEIIRLEEKNRELIAGLKMQIELKINQAKKNRENQIIRVEEALNTAQSLEIVNPVTWDDLRTKREISQITNEFGGTDNSAPFYFQGTRILSAELNRLKSRQDDRPFVQDLPDIQKQISELENDPKIAALKAREDDTIYIERFDELQQELSKLVQTPVKLEKAQLAIISQEAVVSPSPTRNAYVIFLVGVTISIMFGLFLALVKSAFRK